MTTPQLQLRAGDWVKIKNPSDIAQTLDANGSLDGLPFMPEMLPFCGQRFRVSRRVEKTCVEGPNPGIREFIHNDVVFLETLRCSGLDHGGCQRGCMLFWKEAWLQKIPADQASSKALSRSSDDADNIRPKLQTTQGDGRFFCQSAQLEKATRYLTRDERIRKCFREVAVGNFNVLKLAWLFLGFFRRKLRTKLIGQFPSGTLRQTPTETLNLQPGELVEVKPFKELLATLDHSGRNRGLRCTYAAKPYAGRRYRVRERVDRMIQEGTGEMRNVHDTVTLEGSTCACDFVLGGCPRAEFAYWREIWLKRVEQKP